MAIVEGQVGPRLQAQGTTGVFRLGYETELVVNAAHGNYFEAASRGRLFSAANQSAVTFGAGLSATLATLAIYNPLASGTWASLVGASFVFSAAPAGAVAVWLVAIDTRTATSPTSPTELTVRGLPLGRSPGACKAYTAGTLPTTPFIVQPLVSVVAASSITPVPVNVDLGGQIIMPPGTYVAFQASAAASGYCALLWEEIPIPPGM